MRVAAAIVLLCWSPASMADVLNVEFKFTPYTGDPKQDEVQTVPGKARVFINNVPVAEQDVTRSTVPVIFDERQIAPSVWVPVESMGPVVRRGKNTIRIEFQPSDPKAPYHGQLTWASVTDQVTEGESADGSFSSSNQADEGKEDKPVTGKLVFERSFEAGFAKDEPWHHFPAVSDLPQADRIALAEVVKARGTGFGPDFAGVYRALEGKQGLQLDEIRKAKCLDAAYAAGVRISPVAFEQLDFVVTGGPEVLVRGKKGALYDFGAKSAFEKIKGEDAQMCAGVVISIAYPAQLAFARSPSGEWLAVY